MEKLVRSSKVPLSLPNPSLKLVWQGNRQHRNIFILDQNVI